MNNLLKKISTNPLKFLMLIMLIYPVLPLALIAIWWSVVMLSSFFVSHNSTFSIQGLLWTVLALLLFLGGPVGFLAGIYTLLNKVSKKVFWSFLYGAISYSFIVIIVISGSIMKLNVLSFLHGAYLLMTLVVITMALVDMHGSVFKSVKEISLEEVS